jgi:predicted ABC-type ATPase
MSVTNPKLIIIAGANGAGKSTIAPFLLRDEFAIMDYVNADTIAHGLSAFQSEKVALEAGRIMLKRLQELANQHRNFAFESTLASRFYARWIKELRRQGYEFHLFFLWLRHVDVAIARVKERVRIGGHNIPEDVIRRRYQKGLKNFFEIYQPIADTWSVYDNSEADEPIQIAKGNAKIVSHIYQQDLWSQYCEISQ